MGEALRIGLLDDHAVVRTGYRRLIELEDGLEVRAEFASAEEAYAALSAPGACPLDLLVIDLSLPGQGGFELLRRLRMRRPELRLLVFSMHGSPSTVSQCLGAGASGFVTKSSAPEVLVEAVRQVAAGQTALSADVAEAAGTHSEVPAHDRLTMREFDILRRLAAGHGVERIAQDLCLSAKTVANYQTEIRRKLGIANAVELLHYARRHGIAPA